MNVRTKRRLTAMALVVVAVLLAIAVTSAENAGWFDVTVPEDELRPLTRPLRLEAAREGDFEQLVLALGVHHYKAQRKDAASYRDVFFDTPDDRLLANGYTYRFRRRVEYGKTVESIVWLQRHWRARDAAGRKPTLDVRVVLDAELGQAIAAGDWERAVNVVDTGRAAVKLVEVLTSIGAPLGTIEPRYRATLERERYDVTDKGRDWFELDRERWTFERFDGEGPSVSIEDFVLDTRLKKDDPELRRRVRTMAQIADTLHPIRRVDTGPVERAAAALR